MADKNCTLHCFFGGNSSEHDVSKRSAHTVYDALDKDKYEVSVFMFTKDNFTWQRRFNEDLLMVLWKMKWLPKRSKDVDFSNPLANLQNLSEVKDVDLFYPVIHGKHGRRRYCSRLVPFIEQTLYR